MKFSLNTIKKGILVIAFLLLSVISVPAHASTMYTNDTVHMRSEPSTSGSIITTLSKNTAVVVNCYDGNWADVSCNGSEGYIRKDFLSKKSSSKKKKSGTKKSAKKSNSGKKKTTSGKVQGLATVSADNVNLRKKAKGKVISQLNNGDNVMLLSIGKKWDKVITSDGTKGYIRNTYLGNIVLRSDQLSQYKAAAIAYCQNHLEDKYSQDNRDKEGYCDCSSLVRDAFKNATGEPIGENTVDQNNTMKNYLYTLGNIYDASAGDIVYHMSEEGEYHCGLYIGDGAVINASKTVGKVKISYYNEKSSYWEIGCKAASFCYDEKYGTY